jgi:hypothetical protein
MWNALGIALILAAAAAEPYAVGAQLEPFSLQDQHGRAHAVDASVRALLFTREMSAGDIVKQGLTESGAQLLAGAGAVYVSDISGMPALVRRLMALPRLRQRPYPILLDFDGSVTQRIPGGAGQPVLLVLDELRIAEIRTLASAQELVAALRALAPATPQS